MASTTAAPAQCLQHFALSWPSIQSFAVGAFLGNQVSEDDLLSAREQMRGAVVSLPDPSSMCSGSGASVEYSLGVELLRELPEANYRLLQPLSLTVHKGQDYYWVAPERFVLHGVGATPQEAVEDYGYALLDYYEDLRRDRGILAPHLVEHLEYLETIIEEV